ncbi:MAG TPA: rhodanese-like domain-containing protein [Anaerolineaceae bacterium]
MSRKRPKSTQPSGEPALHRRHKPHKRNLAWLWIVLGVLLVAGVGILLLSRSKAAPSVEITPAQAYAKFQQGAFFLDVRSQDEWDQFHIAGSTLIPLDELQNRFSELPKDQDIVVVCLSGHRSQSGVTILQQAGFTRVSCLSGGLQAWTAAGYPVQGNAP